MPPVAEVASAALALAMIAGFILLTAGVKLAAAGSSRRHGLLMIVAAVVILTNVMIWTV